MAEKQLPADINAEAATLGSLLMDRDAVLAVAAWLEPAHFYLEKHRYIYDAILACYAKRIAPDLTSVASELRTREQLAGVGDVAGLVELTNSVATALHVEYYGRTVARTARLRAIIQAGGAIAAIGYDEMREEDDVIAEAFARLTAATSKRHQAGILTIQQAVDAAWNGLERGPRRGVPTGLTDLDRYLGGLHPGNLVILAARPSVGKTSLAGQIAHTAATAGCRVLIFTMEMDGVSIVHRLWSLVTGIDGQRIQLAELGQGELAMIADACGQLAGLPISFDESGTQTMASVRNVALGQAAAHGDLRLIVVDYLQLMSGGGRSENRVQEVSEISRGLKALAREIQCPVLALSQLNRGVEGRNNHIPTLADLRDSGSIEQDADVVLFIYREELYDKDTSKKGVAEIHIAKHRNGPLGMVDTFYDKRTQRWRDLDRGYHGVPGYEH